MPVFHSTDNDKDLNHAVVAGAAHLQDESAAEFSVVTPPTTFYPQTPIRILRLTEVIDRVGLCRASIYQYMATGLFPKQIILGLRSVGWIEHEIDAWLASRAAARGNGGELISD